MGRAAPNRSRADLKVKSTRILLVARTVGFSYLFLSVFLSVRGDAGVMKSLDLFLGVKAEQTLRDMARNASENSTDDSAVPELCPVGKKDWIAGRRLKQDITFREVEAMRSEVIRQLIALGSHQRIRQENLRLYAVRPPVPVFKESVDLAKNNPEVETEGDTMVCPVCGEVVHKFNLQYGVGEKVVGCYLCRGETNRG
jgi:hypothetical protein